MDLFSGIGGFALGLRRAGGYRTVCYCERDAGAAGVLLARMRDGELDPAPIHRDVARLDGKPWRGLVDVITGGFPCQDISGEGAGAGIDGERSGLWREYARLVRQVRPRYVIVENVAILLARGIDRVLGDLASSGYDAEWSVVSACSMGAPHVRDRVFIVAYPHVLGLERRFPEWKGLGAEALPSAEAWRDLPGPYVRPAPYGVSARMVEVGTPGNAVVPQVVEWIGTRLKEHLS